MKAIFPSASSVAGAALFTLGIFSTSVSQAGTLAYYDAGTTGTPPAPSAFDASPLAGDQFWLNSNGTDPYQDQSESSIVNDLASGYNAWNITDNGLGELWYYRDLTTEEIAPALADGWRLECRLRVPDAGTVDGSPAFCLYDGSKFWGVSFSTDGSGGMGVYLYNHVNWLGSPSYSLDANGYHDFALIYNPAQSTASLFVDGVERISDFAGFAATSTLPRVLWGDYGNHDTGEGNFNYVALSDVPEPSCFALLGCGLAVLIGRRNRRN